MPDISKMFFVLALVMLLLGLLFNISPNFPKIPGDLYIDRPGIRVYIPITSAIIISIAISLILNFFIK